MRIARFLIILCCALALAAPDDSFAARKRKGGKRAWKAPVNLGVNDPRYAALVMDANTGEILHERNGSARRYPASLTKMMTLYLLFDALEQKKIDLDDEMDVSASAAGQPETNIDLRPGDEVPVDLAIRAMVVRSANDVAVVIAETLGGNERKFAQMMNQKAALLGMKNTRFTNPNGLPDTEQVSTARDMAKLGIALKRDFPQYYPYFSTREFSWNGVTYYTHNRVMLRYSGVDGIKTGYISKSGFNVITSVERGGRPLIGVVMGGGTGRWRDDQMITLLNTGYTVLAQRGKKRGTIYAQNLPRLPDGSEITVAQAASSDQAVRSASSGAADVAGAKTTNMAAASPFDVVAAEQISDTNAGGDIGEAAQPAAIVTSASPAAKAPAKQLVAEKRDWGIQVGAFTNKNLAEKAAQQARTLISSSLQGSKVAVGGKQRKQTLVHRARLENITETQARTACVALVSKNSPCFIYRAGTQNL